MGSLEVVVDSSVVIGFLRGHEPEASVLAQLLADGRAMMTAITVFELESGLSGYDQWADKISAFTEAVPILPLEAHPAPGPSRAASRNAGRRAA